MLFFNAIHLPESIKLRWYDANRHGAPSYTVLGKYRGVQVRYKDVYIPAAFVVHIGVVKSYSIGGKEIELDLRCIRGWQLITDTDIREHEIYDFPYVAMSSEPDDICSAND